MLEKTRMTMERRKVGKSLPPHQIAFETNREDPADSDHRLRFDMRDYEDMGCPDILTVTIEPGDKLNDINESPFTQPKIEPRR